MMNDYDVLPDGRVWSNKRKIFLSQGLSGDGYLTVGLYKDGKRQTVKVHRLVAQHYIDNPYNKPQVNHKNGNKQDNRVENLEWVTNKENMYHACRLSLQATGEKSYLAKLTESDVKQIRIMLAHGHSATLIAKLFNVTKHNIYAIKNGHSWRHLEN